MLRFFFLVVRRNTGSWAASEQKHRLTAVGCLELVCSPAASRGVDAGAHIDTPSTTVTFGRQFPRRKIRGQQKKINRGKNVSEMFYSIGGLFKRNKGPNQRELLRPAIILRLIGRNILSLRPVSISLTVFRLSAIVTVAFSVAQFVC